MFVMSALTQKADIDRRLLHLSFVPLPEITRVIKRAMVEPTRAAEFEKWISLQGPTNEKAPGRGPGLCIRKIASDQYLEYPG